LKTRLFAVVLALSSAAFAGDKDKGAASPAPTPRPASVLPGCACSTGVTLTSVVVHNCICPGDDGKPLQCVVAAGGVGVSVSCSR
jgi:hypothetical protein